MRMDMLTNIVKAYPEWSCIIAVYIIVMDLYLVYQAFKVFRFYDQANASLSKEQK